MPDFGSIPNKVVSMFDTKALKTNFLLYATIAICVIGVYMLIKG
jgi:hypothetical protein